MQAKVAPPPPVKKEDPGATQFPEYTLLDTSKLSQQLLFLQIPNFVWEELAERKAKGEVGKIIIKTPAGSTTPIVTVVFNSTAFPHIPAAAVPKEFEVRVEAERPLNQYVFTQDRQTGSVRMLGQVSGTARLTSRDSVAMQQARKCLEEAKSPKKVAKQARQIQDVQKPEPVIQPMYRVGRGKDKKEVKDKRLKKSREEMVAGILQAFSENPEWKVKDLAERLNQAPDHVKKYVDRIAYYDQTSQTWKVQQGALIGDE